MMSIIWPFLIYWLVIFVACFVVVEVAQDQLYDEVTPHAGLKVTLGSLLIAMLLTALRYYGFPASFESMFTSNIAWTLLQGVVWFGVFTLILQFHPWHALGLGIATMLMVSGLATMGVESILSRPAATSAAARPFAPTKPVRQSLAPTAGTAQPKTDEKAKIEGRIVRYVTHQFAHLETLERARRWLVQAGIDPGRIEARTHGILQSGNRRRAGRVGRSSDGSLMRRNPPIPTAVPGSGTWSPSSHVTPQADKSMPCPETPRIPSRSSSVGGPRMPTAKSRKPTPSASERLSGRKGLTNRRRRGIRSITEDTLSRIRRTLSRHGQTGRSSRQRMMNLASRSAASIECS